MRICIDAGHGGYDPGAVGQKLTYEKSNNLAVALLLKDKLEKHGFNIILTRNSDLVPWNMNNDLTSRCNIANNNACNIFISIHNDASENTTANGTTTFIYSLGGESEKVANLVQKELVNKLGTYNRGVRTANYTVLVKTIMPAILVELGFISNAKEEELLRSKEYQEKCADAITKGICAYAGVKFLEEVIGMFLDVPNNHWAKESIEFLVKLGILTGYSDGTFKPNNTVTRAELAAVIAKAYKKIVNN